MWTITLPLWASVVRLGVGEAFDQRQATGGVDISIEVGEIPRRGDDGDVPIAALGGLAHLDQLELVGGLGKLLEISEGLVVGWRDRNRRRACVPARIRGGHLGQCGGHRGEEYQWQHGRKFISLLVGISILDADLFSIHSAGIR